MATLMPLDEGTKINIVDDENKILDTGPTGRGLDLATPADASFSVSPRVSCVSCGRYVRTHTRRPAMSGLMAASASFISSALSASPDALVSVYHETRSPAHVRRTDTGRRFIAGAYRPRRSDVGSSGPASSTRSVNSPIYYPRRTDTPMSIGMNLTNNQQ